MRVAMSLLSFRPGRVGGAETYVRQLVEHLPEVAGRDELLLVVDRNVDRELAASGWRKVVTSVDTRALVAQRVLEAYTPWRARELERLFTGLDADVLMFPQQSIFPDRLEMPAVLGVMDVQHVFFPERFGFFDRTFRARVYLRSMQKARQIIVLSEFTRRALIDRCDVPADKVVVVPLGYTPGVSGVAPYRTGIPYLYYPAATYPHKDHATLFKSFAALRRRGDLEHRLLLSGQRTALWKTLSRLAADLGIANAVEHRGFVPREQVDALYAGADTVVFPSRFEGFGLPVVEAAQFAKRIVTSQLPVFSEIGVPRSVQIDFADPDALLAALRQPAPTVLETQPITWREVAARTLSVLRRQA